MIGVALLMPYLGQLYPGELLDGPAAEYAPAHCFQTCPPAWRQPHMWDPGIITTSQKPSLTSYAAWNMRGALPQHTMADQLHARALS
jgi:hypothetical protein